jgi:hypothetical protein
MNVSLLEKHRPCKCLCGLPYGSARDWGSMKWKTYTTGILLLHYRLGRPGIPKPVIHPSTSLGSLLDEPWILLQLPLTGPDRKSQRLDIKYLILFSHMSILESIYGVRSNPFYKSKIPRSSHTSTESQKSNTGDPPGSLTNCHGPNPGNTWDWLPRGNDLAYRGGDSSFGWAVERSYCLGALLALLLQCAWTGHRRVKCFGFQIYWIWSSSKGIFRCI